MKTSLNMNENIETSGKEIHDPQQDEPSDILDMVARRTERAGTVEGLVIGKITGFIEPGVPLVDFSLNPTGRAMAGRTTVTLEDHHIGRDVALMFEGKDVRKPVIIGLMHESRVTAETNVGVLELTSGTDIVLRCGDASIHMHADGRIVIKGREILSRASCNHRIQGGMVNIN